MPTPPLTPQEFVATWKTATLKERSGYQEHFSDLCRLIGHGTPAERDPDGTWFLASTLCGCSSAANDTSAPGARVGLLVLHAPAWRCR